MIRKKMKRPKRIKIGPYHYNISFKKKGSKFKDNKENIGETDFQALTMWVKEGKHEMEAETLLHEAFHGIFATSGISARFTFEEEEELIGALSPWVLLTLLDNPEFTQFILKDLNEL